MELYGKYVRYSAKVMAFLADLVLFCTMAVVAVSVLGRVFFSTPVAGLTDIVSIFNALAVAFAVSVTEQLRKHIRVDFVREYLPPKVGKVVFIIMMAMAAVTLAVITWRFFLYIGNTYSYHSRTWIMGIPHWPAVVCLSIGLLNYLIVMIYNFIDSLQHWGEKKSGPSEDDWKGA
jgi:TRAP-type C4-dicarboxylate transport system permease small subunit